MAPRPKTKESFAEVMTGLLQEQAANNGCPICHSPDRAVIEQSRASGASFPLIARALQKMGIMSQLTLRTAKDKVTVHFQAHMEDPLEDGSYPSGRNGRPGGKRK